MYNLLSYYNFRSTLALDFLRETSLFYDRNG